MDWVQRPMEWHYRPAWMLQTFISIAIE
jgi:hypothetical protein